MLVYSCLSKINKHQQLQSVYHLKCDNFTILSNIIGIKFSEYKMPLRFNKSEEKRFVWDDSKNELVFLGGTEQEDKKIKGRRRKVSIVSQLKIYCPHDYLFLNFLDVLNPSQKIKFRKYYLRKVLPTAPDVIIIQDIKNLVMYLLITPVSVEFINFFHLRVVDRFLRALIMYFQSYTEIWEEIMKKRVAIMTKAPNPLGKNRGLMRADQMQTLRCVLAREYCDLLVGNDESVKYHHMIANTQSTSMISQGEKDLRIFEPLISIAHRVVWIALQRKYFHLIEDEIHRLFRTDAYNTASRKNSTMDQMLMKEEEKILHGPKMPLRRKLLMNSPLTYELFRKSCDFRIFTLGHADLKSKDPRINYLKNALLTSEEKLPELGIKVGILGLPRINYDITLVSIEEEKILKRATAEAWERRRNSLTEKQKKSPSVEKEPTSIPMYGSNAELPSVFPLSKTKYEYEMYDESREEARKKWILRELDRQTYTYSDAMSVATSGGDN